MEDPKDLIEKNKKLMRRIVKLADYVDEPLLRNDASDTSFRTPEQPAEGAFDSRSPYQHATWGCFQFNVETGAFAEHSWEANAYNRITFNFKELSLSPEEAAVRLRVLERRLLNKARDRARDESIAAQIQAKLLSVLGEDYDE